MWENREMIMVVERDVLFENEKLTFQGLLTDGVRVDQIMKNFKYYEELRRDVAESLETYKQPIPYTIIRCGEDVFLYKRLKGSGESRLHDQLSIGIGGHMNPVNDVLNWNLNLITNLIREVNEEITIETNPFYEVEPKVIGLINDDSNEVGRVHIAILSIIDLPEDSVITIKETDKLEGHWVRIRDLRKTPLYDNLETWSQIALGAL